MSASCTNHCRTCGAHFTSLEAFAAHRGGSYKDNTRGCWVDDDLPLVELTGTCKLADPDTPQAGVSVYEHERAAKARDYFGALGGRHTASAERRQAA
jgi:hypothetical protein